jgi:hypothetical protein
LAVRSVRTGGAFGYVPFSNHKGGARSWKADAALEKENEERDDNGEITDQSDDPHALEDHLTFAQWLSSVPITINSVVKPQSPGAQ